MRRNNIDYQALVAAAQEKYDQNDSIPGYPLRSSRSCWKLSCFSTAAAPRITGAAIADLQAAVIREGQAPIFHFLDRHVQQHGKISLSDRHFASYLLFELMRHDSVLHVQERYHKNPIYFCFSVVYRGMGWKKEKFDTTEALIDHIRMNGLTGAESAGSSQYRLAELGQSVEDYVGWATFQNGISSTKRWDVAKRFAMARSRVGSVVVACYALGVDIEKTLSARGRTCCFSKVLAQQEVNILSPVASEDIISVEEADSARRPSGMYPLPRNQQSAEPAAVLERYFAAAEQLDAAPVPRT